jgi:DNA-binding response OmpR family regulator
VNSWNLLLLDADEEFISTLADRLRLRGAIVRTSSSISQSFLQIEASQPQVVVVSLAFEKLAGLDMIRQLKTECPQIGIIALADLGKTKYKEQSLRLGADQCLMKPFQIEELLEALDKIISNQ